MGWLALSLWWGKLFLLDMRRPHQLPSSFSGHLPWSMICLLLQSQRMHVYYRWHSCGAAVLAPVTEWPAFLLCTAKLIHLSVFFRLLECHSTWETLRSSQFGLGVLGLESVSLIVGYDSNVPFCSFPQAAACSGSECEKFTSVGEPLSVLVPPAPTPSGASWGTCWASAYRLGSTLDPSCSQGDRRAWPTSCFCRVFPVTGLSTPRPSCAGSPSEL